MEERKATEQGGAMIARTCYVRPAGPWDTNKAPCTEPDCNPVNVGADVDAVFTPTGGTYGDDGQVARNAAMKAEADAAHRAQKGTRWRHS